MLVPRLIPCLLLKNGGLVKTIRFKDPIYVGDPRNAVKIFNEKEADEIAILDITATLEKRRPPFAILDEIVSEAFMPLAYGGGIRNLEDAQELFSLGVEKIIINSYAVENPEFIRDAAKQFGNQSVLVCLDVKKNLFSKYEVFTHSGTKNTRLEPVAFARLMVEKGAGELIVNSIHKDGTMSGYDINLTRMIADAVSVPVIACGGAGRLSDITEVVREGHASAAAAGSLFVFYGPHRAVLINYPSQREIRAAFHNLF